MMHGQNLDLLRALNQILAAGNLLSAIPVDIRLCQFLYTSMKSLKGVESCKVCLYSQNEPFGDSISNDCHDCGFFDSRRPCSRKEDGDENVLIIPLSTFTSNYACIVIKIDRNFSKELVPALHNLANISAITIENKIQKISLEESNAKLLTHQELLEKNVLERTLELSQTNKQLKDKNKQYEILVSELKVANELINSTNSRLVNALGKAEESDRLKTALLNNLSHEVRTPMNAIMGFSDLLKEASIEDKNVYAEIINDASGQLLSLVDDVILISRLQSEKMPLIKKEFKPAELLSDVLSAFELPTLNKGLVIKKNIPPHIKDLKIESDIVKIRQVLVNLISNSVKYTFEGTIEIGFDLKDGQIEFFVKDTGLGISKNEQQRIFESFFRGERAISLAIRGNGLGLKIAKGLIDLLGGKIGFDSELNKGTCFYFTIPCEILKLETFADSLNTVTRNDLTNLVVLIVDDEFLNSQYLRTLLKSEVKRVDHAISGQKAIELASENKYDIVLMDIKMPGMDGFAATRILKSLFPDLRIIAQTACMIANEKELALDAGCDDFLEKPISKAKLMEVMSKFAII